MKNKLEQDLKSHGFSSTVDEFRASLVEELGPLTVDELLCRPHAAASFAERIRQRFECPLPTPLILKSLLNLRKSPHWQWAQLKGTHRISPKKDRLRLPDPYFPVVEPTQQ